jgi:hypothetical protein
MQRLTLIIPIEAMQAGNVMAAVIGNNEANMTTFDNSLLTPINEPTNITHCWQSSGVTDEERERLGKSLELFPTAIFIFHSNDEAMLVEVSNSPEVMALQGQSLSPMQAIDLLNLAPYQVPLDFP